MPLFSRPQNAQRPDCSVLPKSSWHARLKEHRGVPGDIVVHPGGKNLGLGYPPRASCMCGRIFDRSCREAANQKSRAHKSWARCLSPRSMVDWGSMQHYWCYPSCTWCSNEIVSYMWTTYDGGGFATSLVSVWTAGVGGLCGWSFRSSKCNSSIVGKLSQWNKFICHKWDTFELCGTILHCDIPLYASIE